MSERPQLLLVDDERSIREPLAQYLGRNGFRVTAVENAAEARVRLNANAIDLVILDIMMPGEDGLSLCRHIRETSRSEEHTSELQSLMRISYAVFCLKKTTKNNIQRQ